MGFNLNKQTSLLYMSLFTVIVLAALILAHRYYNSIRVVSIQEDELVIQLNLVPQVVMMPQEVQVNWNVEGINAVFLNDSGIIGTGTHTFVAYCQMVDFNIILRDSSSRNFSLSPFIWTEPINVALISIVITSVSIAIVSLLSATAKQALVRKFLLLTDLSKVDYWERNQSVWTRVALFTIVIVIFPIMSFSECISNQQSGDISWIVLVLTGIFAAILLIVSFFIPQILELIFGKLSDHVPYPIMVVIVFIYWGLIYPSILNRSIYFQFQIGITILSIGIIFLYLLQNKRDKFIYIGFKASSANRYLILFVILISWLFVYLSQWTSYFNNYFIQTFFGLILFILPGLLVVNVILPSSRWSLLISLGFVLSMFFAVALSLLGITFGFSAYIVQSLFTIIGLIVILYLVLNTEAIKFRVMTVASFTFFDILLVSFSMLAVIILMAMNANPETGVDYGTYNALVTQFSQSPQFSLRDPFLGTENTMLMRLWLIAWPVSQALIVTFAKVNILQAMSPLNILLVLLVATTLYELIITFHVPREFALIALIFTAFAIVSESALDQVGRIFVDRLLHDKTMTAWIITPVLLITTYNFLSTGSKRYSIILSVVAFTLVNSHGPSFFYAALICGLTTSLYVFLQSHKWEHLLVIFIIFASCALLPFFLREFSGGIYDFDGEVITFIPFNQEPRLALSSDSALLGIQPNLRNGFAFIIFYVASLIALIVFKKWHLAYYIISACILIFLVSNAITAPWVAKFITPYQLWRATWFMPFGAAAALCIHVLFQLISFQSIKLARGLVLVIIVVLTLIIFDGANTRSREQIILREQYETFDLLLELATYIDSTEAEITVLAERNLTIWIPSLSWNVHPILWRTNTFAQAGISAQEQTLRAADFNRFFAEDLTIFEMNNLIENYDIDYIILGHNPAPNLLSLLENNQRLLYIHGNSKYHLWRIE